jgi:hypothetical protein
MTTVSARPPPTPTPIVSRMGVRLLWMTLLSAVIFVAGPHEYRASVETDGHAVLVLQRIVPSS